MTIIECEECNSKLVASNYGTLIPETGGAMNVIGNCNCGNISIKWIKATQPSKFRGILTIKYKRSYPVITEISEFETFRKEKEEENLKKNKKLGFQS